MSLGATSWEKLSFLRTTIGPQWPSNETPLSSPLKAVIWDVQITKSNYSSQDGGAHTSTGALMKGDPSKTITQGFYDLIAEAHFQETAISCVTT